MYALSNFLTFLWYGAAEATGSGVLEGPQIAAEALETCPDGADVHSHFQHLLGKKLRERADASYVERFRRFAATQASQDYALPGRDGAEKDGAQEQRAGPAPRQDDRREQPPRHGDQPGDKRRPGRPSKYPADDFGPREQRP